MSTSQPRKPRGTPIGGQFASKSRQESTIAVEPDEPWSWDMMVAELGQEETDRLRSESGGSLGGAIARAVGDNRRRHIARQAERAMCVCGHVLADHFLPAPGEPDPFTYCRAGCSCTGFRLSTAAAEQVWPGFTHAVQSAAGVRIESWTGADGQLQDPPDGSPAMRRLRSDGSVESEERYRAGQLQDPPDGSPAVRSFHPDGSVESEEHWQADH